MANNGFYGLVFKTFFDSAFTKINFDSDTIKVALLDSGYTPDFDTHNAFDDLTNEEAGTGYTAGGATLGSKTLTLDTTNNRYVLDAADTTWIVSSITTRYAAVYKSTGVGSTSLLICLINFATDRTSDGGTFQITWHADGIAYLSYPIV